ncbi:7d8c5c6d-9bb5-4523-867b-e99b654bd8a0-CDS [Sclerotinia trifoliorum]|uniref:7d8c5c6d-9bb5-4523-867b-e99b654bd8a0-CDS n=1 Tax=Sclerotinia trifoliorum TaxID=28548 RepID=A0A8H2VT98_9HELO|nr:7d8c5c6d-9bb5-4523-867b-e99b654bd8a0-CDS [Sclerotinia trifoliorum]
MLALTATTGNIGGAVLQAILDLKKIPPTSLIICTSSDPSSPKFDTYKSLGIQVRQSDYEDPSSMVRAFRGVTKLFLVSTPKNNLDFNNAPYGQGRESRHFAAINAAREAGVKHIIYASLAFGVDSHPGVMRAHERTEAYLKALTDIKWTIVREGLYQESWPIYTGFFNTNSDSRNEVVVAADGELSMISLYDLGVANALVLDDESGKYEGKFFFLSRRKTVKISEILAMVSKVKGREITLKIVDEEEFVRHYVENGLEKAMLEWWVSSFTAVREGGGAIDDATCDELLESVRTKPKEMEETVREMLQGGLKGYDKLN